MANTTAVAQEQTLVPTFTATIGGIEQTCVDARFLHAYLQNGDHFAGWMNSRLQKYGFEEGSDYELISGNTETKTEGGFSGNAEKPSKGGRPPKDYRISLDMAKELSMVENNDRGREARRYFIAMERKALGLAQAQQLPGPDSVPRQAPAENLTAHDMGHLKRLVWLCARQFHSETAATQGIWHYLRLATNNPAPNAYTVEHLPTLAVELRRILNISTRVNEITRAIEAEALRRIFRRGHQAEQVLAQLEAKAQQQARQQLSELKALPTWLETDFAALTQRKPCATLHIGSYQTEQPDFFRAAA